MGRVSAGRRLCATQPAQEKGGVSPLSPAICAWDFPLSPGPCQLAMSPLKVAEALVLEPGKLQYQVLSQDLTGHRKPCLCLGRKLGSGSWTSTHGLQTREPWALPECLGIHRAPGRLHRHILFSRERRHPGCGPAGSLRLPAPTRQGFLWPWARAPGAGPSHCPAPAQPCRQSLRESCKGLSAENTEPEFQNICLNLLLAEKLGHR